MWTSAAHRDAYKRKFLRPDAAAATRAIFQRHARGNSLFINQGHGGATSFRDVSLDAHVTKGGWAWSSRFADVNNDGWEDLVVANGYITQEDPQDL
jgi:hypothetical protein